MPIVLRTTEMNVSKLKVRRANSKGINCLFISVVLTADFLFEKAKVRHKATLGWHTAREWLNEKPSFLPVSNGVNKRLGLITA